MGRVEIVRRQGAMRDLVCEFRYAIRRAKETIVKPTRFIAATLVSMVAIAEPALAQPDSQRAQQAEFARPSAPTPVGNMTRQALVRGPDRPASSCTFFACRRVVLLGIAY